MKSWLLFLAFALLVGTASSGCRTPGDDTQTVDPRETSGPVDINIQNDSDVDFDSVRVTFPSQKEDYGAVPQGGQSDYRTVALAYGYAYVEVFVGEARYVVQPTDYTGETPLAEGRYTYALSLSGQELSLALIKR